MKDASPVRWIAAAMMTTCVLSGDAVGADARAKADISCRPAANKLQYDCTIKLTDARTDEPPTVSSTPVSGSSVRASVNLMVQSYCNLFAAGRHEISALALASAPTASPERTQVVIIAAAIHRTGEASFMAALASHAGRGAREKSGATPCGCCARRLRRAGRAAARSGARQPSRRRRSYDNRRTIASIPARRYR